MEGKRKDFPLFPRCTENFPIFSVNHATFFTAEKGKQAKVLSWAGYCRNMKMNISIFPFKENRHCIRTTSHRQTLTITQELHAHPPTIWNLGKLLEHEVNSRRAMFKHVSRPLIERQSKHEKKHKSLFNTYVAYVAWEESYKKKVTHLCARAYAFEVGKFSWMMMNERLCGLRWGRRRIT